MTPAHQNGQVPRHRAPLPVDGQPNNFEVPCMPCEQQAEDDTKDAECGRRVPVQVGIDGACHGLTIGRSRPRRG